MNGKKAKALRKANPVDRVVQWLLLDKRYVETQHQRTTLALEKADIKAEKAAEKANA